MISNLIEPLRKPDILDCIANLSSDEVFTPPSIANQVLDLLPAAIWSDPKIKILDPCAKSGVFLREAAKRLMTGLAAAIPDEDERRAHIFKNMLYGLAITELTGLISRRSLYYSKDASSEWSVAGFNDEQGNVHYSRGKHVYKAGKCVHCGVAEGSLDRGEQLENYAYQFIHKPLREIFSMKFDVIIGNPPYQLEDGGNKASASPIYQLFVEAAKSLRPKYISFIIPSRWFAGGKGLDEFRDTMLKDKRLSKIVDFFNASDCFPGVEIKGGVCYFLWDSSHNGDCEVRSVVNGVFGDPVSRPIDKYDVFVRFNQSTSILEKVMDRRERNIAHQMSSRKPFGLPTNFDAMRPERAHAGDLHVFGYQRQGYISAEGITVNRQWITKYKVLLSSAYNGGDNYPHQIIGRPFIAEPGEICTETYMVCGVFDTRDEAEMMENYMKTRFFRFLVWLRKISQHNPKDRFEFVPDIALLQRWTDEELFARYSLDEAEVSFIMSMIREMD